MNARYFKTLFQQTNFMLKVINRSTFNTLSILPQVQVSSIQHVHTRNLSSDTRSIGLEKPSFTNRIKKRLFLQFRKYKLRTAAFLLYESIADFLDYEEIMKDLDLPDTFNSWFVITELHVWMLMARLMNEQVEGRFARNCVVEALWQDVTTRAKKLEGEHPSIIRKQVQILNEEFQASLVTYDEGLLSNDKVLANALWRRLFNQECNSVIVLESMVKYVRQTMFMLDRTNTEDLLRRKKFKWITMAEIFDDLPAK